MLDFKKILVPYDGSSHAKKALNQAISLAQCSDGAELYVATILNSTIPADDDPDQVDMAEVEKLIPENIPHKVLLEMGEPVPMLPLSGRRNRCRPDHHGQPRPRRSQEPFHGFRFQRHFEECKMPRLYHKINFPIENTDTALPENMSDFFRDSAVSVFL